MNIRLINDNFTSDYVENLLHSRGIDDVSSYLNPSKEVLQDPSALRNIRVGATLYHRIVSNGGRLLMIVDCDVDGFSSAAILYQYTKQLNENCTIDYWFHEGKKHGLNDFIQDLLTQNISYDLLLLADSSSNDAQYHDVLEDVNLPCLIIDHHEVDERISNNAIIINNQMSSDYHNKSLVGAGMVYQFCRYMDQWLRHDWADNYLDLAALGQIGDMGSLLPLESRYIVTNGLANINNKFFRYLIEKQAYSITGNKDATFEQALAKLTPTHVAFYIVPMLNAVNRVGTNEEKRLLFIAFIDGDRLVPCNKRGAKGTEERAAVEAARIATNARAHQNTMKDDAVAALKMKIDKCGLLDNQVLFLRLEKEDNFPAELNGLIANQLANEYKRPTIVARLNSKGEVKGSLRGVNQSALTDFKSFLMESGYFEWCAGHSQAAGCCILDKNLAAFHQYANQALAQYDFCSNFYDVNFERKAGAMDLGRLITEISRYTKIWGQGNPVPLIAVTKIPITPNTMRVMGAHQDTLKIECGSVSFLKFFATDLIQDIQQYGCNCTIDIIGEANLNEYKGRVTPQIFIKDYEIKEGAKSDFAEF